MPKFNKAKQNQASKKKDSTNRNKPRHAISGYTAKKIQQLIFVSSWLTQELGRLPIPEELALEMGILDPMERRNILISQVNNDPLEPALAQRLRSAANEVRRIVKMSQEPTPFTRKYLTRHSFVSISLL